MGGGLGGGLFKRIVYTFPQLELCVVLNLGTNFKQKKPSPNWNFVFIFGLRTNFRKTPPCLIYLIMEGGKEGREHLSVQV